MPHKPFKAISLIATTVVLCAGLGCVPKKLGNGVQETKTYDFGPIEDIEITGNWTVFAEAGVAEGSQRIMVKTDGNLLDFVDLTPTARRLVVSVKEPINPRSGLELHLRLAKIASFSSAGGVKTQMNFSDQGGRIKVAGLSRVDAKILGGDLTIDARGASRVTLDGQAQSLSIESESASRVNAADTVVETAKVVARDASRVNIHAKSTLSISTAGSANVTYDGRVHKPAVTAASSGASQVIKIEGQP